MARNVVLIAAQHAQAYAEGRTSAADPTYVGGFQFWKTLGRSVDKGQHGYVVLAPMTGNRRMAVDPKGQSRPLRPNEAPVGGETEHRRNVLYGFKVEYVFDISQTSGLPVPEPVRPRLLEGKAPPGLGVAVMRLIEQRGYRVDTVPDADAIGGANGQTDWVARKVVVRADMDDAAMVKSLLHEAGHVLCHETPPGQLLPRTIKEVEAESVAFVVASAHGMPTDDYSFPYITAWAGEDAVRAVQATQARVGAAAKAIIEASPAIHELGGKPPVSHGAVAAARQEQLEGQQRPVDLGGNVL